MSKVEPLLLHLDLITKNHPSLTSQVATLKEYVLLPGCIIFWMPAGPLDEFEAQNQLNIHAKYCSMWSRIWKILVDSFTSKSTMDDLVTDCMSTVRDIRPAVKELHAIHLKKKYGLAGVFLSDQVEKFVDDLVLVQQEILSSNDQAIISVQNLKSYLDFSKHFAKACENEEELLTAIWYSARLVADHTAIFLYSCWDLEPTHMLQMSEETNKDTSGFYFQFFNSFSISEDSPLADDHDMNIIDHLLDLKNQIMDYQECNTFPSLLKDQLDKLLVYETLVKETVPYPPLSLQNMSDKMTLHESIIKSAIAISSFSFANDSEGNSGKEKRDALLRAFDERFTQIAAELAKAGVRDHLLSDQILRFADDMALAQQIRLSFSEQAIISVQHLRSYLDLSKHLANACVNEEALLAKIWYRAQVVANHTAKFLYSCCADPTMDLDLKLIHFLQMNDPTNPDVSGFYLQIFDSLSLSADYPLRDEHEMNSTDNLLLHLNSRIVHFQECQATSVSKAQLATIHVYVKLVKDIVLYSPWSVQNICSKITLHENIIKCAISVSAFSFAKNSEASSLEEENTALHGAMDESFNKMAAELMKVSFIDHLFLQLKKKISNCRSSSIVHSVRGQLDKFSEYMTLLKAIVSYPPLRYMFSKIILQKVIVKFVIIISALSSIDTEVKDHKALYKGIKNFFDVLFSSCFNKIKEEQVKKNPELLPKFDMTTLIEEYLKFMADVIPEIKELHDLHVDMKYEVNGEQAIGKYIDGLAEVQKQYLSTNKQAIVSVQNLRTFQHLSKVLVDWYKDEDMLNNLMHHLLVVVEHTSIFLFACWIEPETNHELKLTNLLHMTTIKNSMVHSIYVQWFKSLGLSEYYPWPDELSVFSFIDHLILYLKELMQCETRSIVSSLKECLENLHRYLTVLRNMVAVEDIVPFSGEQYMPSGMKSFRSLVIKFVKKLARFSIDGSVEGAGKKDLALLRDLEENISLMKLELRKFVIFDYPSNSGELFSLFENLEQLLTSRTDVIAPLKCQLDMVYADLLKLRSFMDKIKDKHIENKEQVKNLRRRVIQVSYRVDFIIQSYVIRNGPTYYHALQLSFVMEDIQLLITEINRFDANPSSDGNVEETYDQLPEGNTPDITDMVGFEDESVAILDQLTRRSKKRNIVAIVGMPGLGKTTIAKKVYNDVANRFDRRAWCCVSQSYQARELLLQIYCSIAEVNDDGILKKSDHEIAEMVWRCLKKCRYLIVLDDVWETKVWDDLKRSFPDDNNESRVIITSRDHHVAQALIKATSHGHVHRLRAFCVKESYTLLKQKLSPQHVFPDSGEMIAKNCKGIPLAVVLAAGILSRMEKNEAHWKKFAKSLSKQIGNQCKNLIELSYTHLPDHLKCCFLYFGAFPEDKDISARKLAWLWIAEGFVRDANPERLEDIAERYLMDLIGRSLVIGSKSASRPGIKSCHVHDLLHEFCLAKAEEENFLQVVRGYEKYLPPDNIHFDFGVNPSHAKDPSKITHLQYRLSIYSKRKHFILAKPSGPNARTLFFHALADMHPNCRYDASFVSRYFKLVKVLDFGSINIGKSLIGVALTLDLKYLEVKGDIESIPISKENLSNLETFILKGSEVATTTVPNSIWSLLRLRHLHIDGYTFVKFNINGIADSTTLADMESFSTPTVSYGDDVENMLRRLPNIRKLKCIFMDSWDHIEWCNRFPVLEFLTQLLSLKVSCNYKPFHSSRRYPCRFSFPSNLTKLTLSEFGLPWSEISAIGKLPKLNALKLLSNAFTGKSWDMSEGEFLNLKFLKLESLDIEEWTATDEHIPRLQTLILSKCKKLKEIPSEFRYIDTLEIIEVHWCNASVATCIQEKAKEEYGDDTFKVHIYPNEENPGASS